MEDSQAVDINAFLDRQPLKASHWKIAAALLLVFFLDNFCMQIMSLTAPAIAIEWSADIESLASSMAIGWLGTAFGAVILGLTGDKIGRRWTVIIATILAAAGTGASGIAESTNSLLIFRAIAGFGLGGAFPPALALLTECLPAGRRGLAVSAAMICGPFGIIGCSLVAGPVIAGFGWQTMFFAGGCAMALSSAIVFLALVESPVYLAGHPGRRAELERSLLTFDVVIEPGARILAPPSEGRVSPAMLFKSELRVATSRIWLSFFAVFLIIAALLSWLPTMLARVGFSIAAGGTAISAWSGGGILGTLAAGWFIGRWGARVCARTAAGGAAVGFAALMVVPLRPDISHLTFLAPMLVIGFMSSGLMTALYAHVTEVYPAYIRSTGVGMAEMVGRGTSVFASYVSIFALDFLGMPGFFGALAVVAAIPSLILTGHRLAAGQTNSAGHIPTKSPDSLA